MIASARFARSISAAALIAASSACSNAGAGNSVPATAVAPSHTVAAGARVRLREFSDLPRYDGYYFPTALTLGPDGALWVADDIDQDAGESAIARVTTSGKRTNTYYYPNSASPAFAGITTGSDGALWIVDAGDGQILRLTTGGVFSAFPVGNMSPYGITGGPDGALWFTENGFNTATIGRITTQGTITTYTTGISPGAVLQGIAVGHDGALWFTESSGDRIGRITTAGTIKEYAKGITGGSEPYSIAPGPDGALWFTEMAGGRIGRITTAGKVTEYSRGITPSEHPTGITAGPDNAMWFTESEGSYQYYNNARVGRIALDGTIAEYGHFGASSDPTGIVEGPLGDLWFVETAANKLGRVRLLPSV